MTDLSGPQSKLNVLVPLRTKPTIQDNEKELQLLIKTGVLIRPNNVSAQQKVNSQHLSSPQKGIRYNIRPTSAPSKLSGDQSSQTTISTESTDQNQYIKQKTKQSSSLPQSKNDLLYMLFLYSLFSRKP